ncbi:YALI0F24057p [Yarrowia lipolytica CLIB122]|uniref:YALI0F24057p n=1 Tax=Yarrowia lipolytica (strain CLIB 122 / E 150) TaxID=284591 RepID=Q6C0J8_YARLI|nr:YALI0F24057p [Yarrowia lipolytica CLIB122]CAG78625.1 YALI0F24057p [Yarrowia lipolytica CLIB122]|eukprot:XP_505814.1 YALI0F24057p [Yarrowia lipolytica CLIB122]
MHTSSELPDPYYSIPLAHNYSIPVLRLHQHSKRHTSCCDIPVMKSNVPAIPSETDTPSNRTSLHEVVVNLVLMREHAVDTIRLTRIRVDALGQELTHTTRESNGHLTCEQLSAFEDKMETLQTQLLKAQQVQALTSHILDVVIRWPSSNLDMRTIRKEARMRLQARLEMDDDGRRRNDDYDSFPSDPETAMSSLMSLLTKMAV